MNEKKNPNQAKMIKMLEAIKATEPSLNAETWKKINSLSDEELLMMLFKVRKGKISLTYFGNKVMKECYQHWELKLEKPLSAKQHLLLSRACTLPYYISQGKVVIFEARIGALLKMGEGNNKFIEQFLG